MGTGTRQRSWWGWGWADAAVTGAELGELLRRVPPGWVRELLPVPDLGSITLRAPRCSVPGALSGFCSTRPADRISHTYGKAYRDVMRALAGEFDAAPDVVAFPENERQVADVLEWAGESGTAVVPFGGGSSVVGGVEYRGERPVVSLDLTRMDRVVEVDTTARAALVQAGVFGPSLEQQLTPYGLTLRHFPQSFEFSTLGGWLATRSGGHFATGPTHIDDFCESMRVISPAGGTETLRLPASGAGPSPDRLFLGSEGAFGVITQAWLRLLERPAFKASVPVTFDGFATGLSAVRAVAQSGLRPSNCRLLDPAEAAINTGRSDGRAVLVLGFESADHPVDAQLARAVELAREHGGTVEESRSSTAGGTVGDWRDAFVRMPYVRDALARSGMIVETFETACLWGSVERLCAEVAERVGAAITEVCGEPGLVTARLTHAYPDGAAPYFTVLAPARRGAEVRQWDRIKSAAGDVLAGLCATITHHHAVGRDHLPWYERQVGRGHLAALRAVKETLDPHGILNPGALLPA